MLRSSSVIEHSKTSQTILKRAELGSTKTSMKSVNFSCKRAATSTDFSCSSEEANEGKSKENSVKPDDFRDEVIPEGSLESNQSSEGPVKVKRKKRAIKGELTL